MLLMTGVDSVESSSRQKATKNSIDKGVAGRSMMAKDSGRVSCEDPARQRPALQTRGGVERQSQSQSQPRGAQTSRERSRKQAYARNPKGETSGDWGCTGEAGYGIGPAEGGARQGNAGARRDARREVGRWCCGEAWPQVSIVARASTIRAAWNEATRRPMADSGRGCGALGETPARGAPGGSGWLPGHYPDYPACNVLMAAQDASSWLLPAMHAETARDASSCS